MDKLNQYKTIFENASIIIIFIIIFPVLFYSCNKKSDATKQQEINQMEQVAGPRDLTGKSISDYTQLIEKDQNNAELYIKRGNIYDNLIGDYTNAVKDYSMAIEMDRNNVELYLMRAKLYFSLEKKSNADMDILQALEIKPEDAELYLECGNIYKNAHEYLKAIEFINKSIRINSNNAIGYNNRGHIYAIGFENYKKAIGDFNKAIELDSTCSVAYYNRGMVYAHFQNKEKACSDWKKAFFLGNLDGKEMLEKYCK